jgi:hypothetical protein
MMKRYNCAVDNTPADKLRGSGVSRLGYLKPAVVILGFIPETGIEFQDQTFSKTKQLNARRG